VVGDEAKPVEALSSDGGPSGASKYCNTAKGEIGKAQEALPMPCLPMQSLPLPKPDALEINAGVGDVLQWGGSQRDSNPMAGSAGLASGAGSKEVTGKEVTEKGSTPAVKRSAKPAKAEKLEFLE
jgi:hypothetical protein